MNKIAVLGFVVLLFGVKGVCSDVDTNDLVQEIRNRLYKPATFEVSVNKADGANGAVFDLAREQIRAAMKDPDGGRSIDNWCSLEDLTNACRALSVLCAEISNSRKEPFVTDDLDKALSSELECLLEDRKSLATGEYDSTRKMLEALINKAHERKITLDGIAKFLKEERSASVSEKKIQYNRSAADAADGDGGGEKKLPVVFTVPLK